jgi:hypothetical protein
MLTLSSAGGAGGAASVIGWRRSTLRRQGVTSYWLDETDAEGTGGGPDGDYGYNTCVFLRSFSVLVSTYTCPCLRVCNTVVRPFDDMLRRCSRADCAT